MTLLRHMAALAFAAAVPALPVLAEDDEMVGETCCMTDWFSDLSAGIDGGWVGTWKLVSATFSDGVRSLQVPSAGHTLTVDYFGNYVFDYSTAYFLAEIQLSSPSFSGTVNMVPPAGLIPAGVPEPCVHSAQFEGRMQGQIFAPFDMDLDRLDADDLPIYGLPWMEAAIDHSNFETPRITCPGAQVDVRSSSAMMPIGAGPPVTGENGEVVLYDYVMNEDLTDLVVTARGVPPLQYHFVRQ